MKAAAEKNLSPRCDDLVRQHAPQAAKFAGVGLFNTALDFLVFVMLEAAGLFALGANFAAFFCANGASYALNARLTFQGGAGPLSPAGYIKFLSVHLVSLAVSTAFIAAFAEGALPAKIAAAALTFVWNYAGSAFLVFRKGGAKP